MKEEVIKMNKKELIIVAVFGGLLLKIIDNQIKIDDHIFDINDGRYAHYYDSYRLSNNTLKAKIERFITKHRKSK